MPYRVHLRTGHPRKQFRRDGRLFVEGEPQVLDTLSKAMQRELAKPGSWLVATEIAAGDDQERAEEPVVPHWPLSDLRKMKKDDLAHQAELAGIDGAAQMSKAELVTALREGAAS